MGGRRSYDFWPVQKDCCCGANTATVGACPAKQNSCSEDCGCGLLSACGCDLRLRLQGATAVCVCSIHVRVCMQVGAKN